MTAAPARTQDRTSDRTEQRRLVRPTDEDLTSNGQFSLDRTRIPKGYVMEWKRQSVLGAQDRRNLVTVERFHWQPVPHKMQPHILGSLCQNADQQIVVGGMGLYMRPAYLNADARAEQENKTADVLRNQLQSIRQASKDSMGPAGAQRTFVKKSIEVPQDTV